MTLLGVSGNQLATAFAVNGIDLWRFGGIEEAGRRLNAAAPDADIILFGSRARGETRPDSDLDLLVIEPDFPRRGDEYGQLRKEPRGLEAAVDLVVYRRRGAGEGGGVRAASSTGRSEKALSLSEPDLFETSRILLK